ncbi:sigma-70 family RNA polymerase sigma factor [Reichenbachiella sp. MALMAid0571]|uniref:RNA polymerase sigma factor n=1 Tax=Reichenbachiella sp. MALMAid0571 TaxID=3143939 RepID=UPI0032DFA97A
MKEDISSDQINWEALRSGDTGAFSALYNTYSKVLLAYGRRVHNDRQLIADAVQELFTYLWTRRSHLGETASVKFYLIKALRTIIIKELKKTERNSEYKLEDHAIVYTSREREIIDGESNDELQSKIKNALENLSKREQEILYLKYFTGANNEEIAELLDIKYQSVKNTSFAALKKLRNHFGNNELRILAIIFLL